MLRDQPRRRSKLKYLFVGVIVIAGIGLGYQKWHTKKSLVMEKRGIASQAAKDNHPNRIRLLVAGDFIAHDSVNSAAKQPNAGYDYLPLMKDFVPIFKAADIRFCNDPILNGGQSLGITGYPKFNSPTEFVTDMGRLGCNLVSLASNHSFDLTQANITNSVEAWSRVPNMLAVAGENRNPAERDTIHYFTLKGVKFAFLSCSSYFNAPPQNDYGVNRFSEGFVSSQIKTAKQNGAEIIITSIRWGTEYSTTADAEQKQTAQFLADQGVQLVLGHGSHELQPVQELSGKEGNKTTVWYSIGNFLNTQEPAETLFNGLPVIDFDTKTKQITAMSFLPTYMHYEWTAAQASADQISARHNLHMYLLENATQTMIDAQQLRTTVDAQKQRMRGTLSSYGLNIPFISSQDYRK